MFDEEDDVLVTNLNLGVPEVLVNIEYHVQHLLLVLVLMILGLLCQDLCRMRKMMFLSCSRVLDVLELVLWLVFNSQMHFQLYVMYYLLYYMYFVQI